MSVVQPGPGEVCRAESAFTSLLIGAGSPACPQRHRSCPRDRAAFNETLVDPVPAIMPSPHFAVQQFSRDRPARHDHPPEVPRPGPGRSCAAPRKFGSDAVLLLDHAGASRAQNEIMACSRWQADPVSPPLQRHSRVKLDAGAAGRFLTSALTTSHTSSENHGRRLHQARASVTIAIHISWDRNILGQNGTRWYIRMSCHLAENRKFALIAPTDRIRVEHRKQTWQESLAGILGRNP